MSKRPPTLDDVVLAAKDQDVHTFSNGTEWDCWANANCYDCRWWNPETAGEDCAFEAAAFLHGVTPELAAKFGWLQTETKYGPRSGWDAPDQCAFFMRRNDGGDDDTPDPPIIDPAQLSFIAPEGFPAVAEAPYIPIRLTVPA